MQKALDRLNELAKRAVELARNHDPDIAEEAMKALIMFAVSDARMKPPCPSFEECKHPDLDILLSDEYPDRHKIGFDFLESPETEPRYFQFFNLYNVTCAVYEKKVRDFHQAISEIIRGGRTEPGECEWCEAKKRNKLGLCNRCGRFPSADSYKKYNDETRSEKTD